MTSRNGKSVVRSAGRPNIAQGMSSAHSRSAVGAGLVALDYVMTNDDPQNTRVWAGGTCGNVLTILAFLGWKSYPIARLQTGLQANLLRKDLERWGVLTRFVTEDATGSTPIILHRILREPGKPPRHAFSTRCRDCGHWFPTHKPITRAIAQKAIAEMPTSDVFFFDRVSPGALELANHHARNNGLVMFEPNSVRDERLFNRACEVAHVVKYSQTQMMDQGDLLEQLGPNLLIETNGAEGLRFKQRGSAWVHLAAVPAPVVRDTAGAGDWLSAGFLSVVSRRHVGGELRLERVKASLAHGQRLAAINCAYEGARGAMYHLTPTELASMVRNLQETRGSEPSLPPAKATPRLCPDCSHGPAIKSTAVTARKPSAP